MVCEDEEVYVKVCEGDGFPLYELVAPQKSGGERVAIRVLPVHATIACSDGAPQADPSLQAHGSETVRVGGCLSQEL